MLQLKSKKDVLKIVKDRDVSFIQIWFTDILGILKSFAITPSELEGALTEGMGFDGSSIEGFARIEESDMIAMPDPTTFQFLPWRPKDRPVARMFCDILTPDGSHYAGDPRYVFKRALQKAADKGYKFFIGPELEFFYFENSENREIFTTWQETDDLPSLKENLDLAIHEHLDTIMGRSLPANNVEHRFIDCILELKKQYYRSFEAKRAEILTLEVESGGTGADLARLEEEGIEPSTQLREVFARKNQKQRS